MSPLPKNAAAAESETPGVELASTRPLADRAAAAEALRRQPALRRVCLALYAGLFLGLVVVPLVRSWQAQREAAALDGLNAIWVAQCTFFREDLDGDGLHDYAHDLAELERWGALDPSALPDTYTYRVENGTWTWVAYADPKRIGDPYLGLGPMFGVMAPEGRGVRRSEARFAFTIHLK
ncbi:MAG: hypothetical protein KDD82_23865 [Planctomycetes bacterium]|nr:hypothetical protein [Planctomycetota bacterium]